VLVAEDNPLNQKLAKLQLLKLGIKADCVANGHEAVTAVARRPYDVVLMDCQMPEMDGYEASREIRRLKLSGHPPKIIAITAHALEGDRERCIAAGMDGYLSKPVDLNKLEKALNEVPAEPQCPGGARQETAAPASSLTATPGASPAPQEKPEAKGPPRPAAPLAATAQIPDGAAAALDAHAVAELRAEGDGLLDELIGMFLEQLPTALAAIAKALAGKDWQAIAFHAHRLKGSVGNFGARAMTEICQSLETAAKAADLAQAESMFDRLEAEAERVRRAMEQERTAASGASAA
jgi:two-component system sensor histidine kinase/response regulator